MHRSEQPHCSGSIANQASVLGRGCRTRVGAVRAQAPAFRAGRVSMSRDQKGGAMVVSLRTMPLLPAMSGGGRWTRSTSSQTGPKGHREAGPRGPHHVPRDRQGPGAPVACTVFCQPFSLPTCQVAGRGMKEVTEGAGIKINGGAIAAVFSVSSSAHVRRRRRSSWVLCAP